MATNENPNIISINLWFDAQAEEAARFYTQIFKDSTIEQTSYYGNEGQDIHGKSAGMVMSVTFTLQGQKFMALNGGPDFTFNEAISFIVHCDTQEEVDYYWEKLSANPSAEQCGWLKDQFGVSWQVVPRQLSSLLSDADTEKSQRAMKAMLQMKKLNIAELQQAFDGE